MDAPPHDDARVADLVERAFHFRGDVTVRTRDGAETTGFLYNRDAAPRNGGGACAHLFEAATGRDVAIAYDAIADVAFTGRPGGRAAGARSGPLEP